MNDELKAAWHMASTGLGVLLGAAFAHHLLTNEPRNKAREERLQEGRGLARLLAAEIGTLGTVFVAKAYGQQLNSWVQNSDQGINPDVLFRFIE